MNKRRRARAPQWPRLVALIAAALLLAALLFGLGKGVAALLGLLRGDDAARDPQFAEPAEQVTRPPELDERGRPLAQDDPSAAWELGEQTPVDKTAEELSREAEQAAP